MKGRDVPGDTGVTAGCVSPSDAASKSQNQLAIRQAIGKWRDSLVNLTGTNRLLNFKPSKTGMLTVASPAPGDVFTQVTSGKSFAIRSLQEEDEPSGPPGRRFWLDVDTEPSQLAATLRSLYRRSEQAFLDQGLLVLYLAFGVLAWQDEDGTSYTSPLLLVPVRFAEPGSRQTPMLKPTEDDPVVNPVLTLKLSRQGITLPSADIDDLGSLDSFLDSIRKAIPGRAGWKVQEGLIISCFSFSKEAMYRDLLENEDVISGHPVIAAFAGGVREGGHEAGFYFDEIPDHLIDERAAAEAVPTILDADSSQRACIAAALSGRSFVMDGPPGTGKSQTIANIIAALLHAGKTVLFVSEKAAALDVVRGRLDKAGLGHFVLELHSQKATRKEVATALGKALDNRPLPPSAMPDVDRATVRARREQLNKYADAMNRDRQPLGLSMHRVLGMIAQLHDLPAAPATGHAPLNLTIEAFTDIRREARLLASAWRPARQGNSFTWRGVTEQGSLDACLYQAKSALQALRSIAQVNRDIASTFGLTRPSDAGTLGALLDHLAACPAGTPVEWLTNDRLESISVSTAALAADLQEITASEAAASAAAGIPWHVIPKARMLPTIPDPGEGLALTRAPEAMTAHEIAALSAALASDAAMLAERRRSLGAIAGMLGMRAPETFSDVEDLLAVALLADAPDRPERMWLTPQGLAAAQEAVAVLSRARQISENAAAQAKAYFTQAALNEDLEALAAVLDEHHGLGKLVSGDYRTARKTVAAVTVEEIDKDVAQRNLGRAITWRRAVMDLAAAEQAHAAALGSYYEGPSTQFNKIVNALGVAQDTLRRARGQVSARLADHIARNSRPTAEVTGIARNVARDLAHWRANQAESGWPAELLGGTVDGAITWIQSQRAPLDAMVHFADSVSQEAGRPVTLKEASHLVELAGLADGAHAQLAAKSGEYRDTFGSLYNGLRTDIDAVRRALIWTRVLRQMIGPDGDPLTHAQVKAMGAAVPTPGLAATAIAWREAARALIAAFSADRQSDLSAELDDYANAEDLIDSLREDSGGQDEWHAYLGARENLARHGLAVAIDFCISERVPAERVPFVIERAVLQEWADFHLRSDSALVPVRAQDRDGLVAEYRRLDRELVSTAAGEIIRACNRRRPRTDVGEAAHIHREAAKKKRHMPVRTLIDRTRNVTQAIVPCFMMSPLSVSQFLPPDLQFDAVIFDEASQVSPADAINCTYRGSALILAGDQKQLPPSNFFTAEIVDNSEEWSEDSDDTADFESVLELAKSAGTFRSLTLRWHYRSRHEALIAFSNASFYEGKLVTFPGARESGPDVGVELFQVDGTYRRGSARDNPVEAAEVAARVIHHYETRPGMSLGVVTFSEAQAEAIEAAVRQARQGRAELDRFFEEDSRLHGFFVKSLESVQGDERDVMIFSIGYGPDENGKLTMNFGPLNRRGGWRRLNVAITRAHYRNEIVSSIRAVDISESVHSESGVGRLRRYLDYAARGVKALALDTSSGGDAESPFEESVIAVIRSWGYDLVPQVGTAGYRIDIGVKHASHPGAFALGVECDGYRYHSSRTARDRDRLREEVLRGLGWRLYRIWGTAWYRDRNGEEAKLRSAIEEAVAAPVSGLLTHSAPSDGICPAIATTTVTFDEKPQWAKPYQITWVTGWPARWGIRETRA